MAGGTKTNEEFLNNFHQFTSYWPVLLQYAVVCSQMHCLTTGSPDTMGVGWKLNFLRMCEKYK